MARRSSLSPRVGAAVLLLGVAAAFSPYANTGAAQQRAQQNTQPPKPGAARGIISGRVIDEAGQPFPYVVVTVSRAEGTDEERRQVATDESGSFKVDDLAAAAYDVGCYAEAYVEDPDDDSKIYHLTGDSVTLRLRKGGVISGTVTDEAGTPLVRVEVAALRVRDADGHRVNGERHDAHAETDDRGIYRIYGLEAGSYLVRLDRLGQYEDKERAADCPVYYPSATGDGAVEVKILRGSESLGINLIHRREAGHTISGKLGGAVKKEESDEEAFVKVIRAGSGVLQSASYQGYKSSGAFAIHGLPDGDYLVIAQDDVDEPGAASAVVPISVRGSDVGGLKLTLLPFASVAGRAVMELTPATGATVECKQSRPRRLEEMTVSATRLEPAATASPAVDLFPSHITAVPKTDGEFRLSNLFPGTYRLEAWPLNEDLYVRAIAMPPGEHHAPALAGSNMVALKAGEQIKGFSIRLSDGAAILLGRVASADPKTRLPERVRVYLVPADLERQNESLRYRETTCSTDGSFSFKHLAPGRYWARVRAADSKEDPHRAMSGGFSTPTSRAALRREAEARGAVVDLRPCQRVNDFSVRYGSSN